MANTLKPTSFTTATAGLELIKKYEGLRLEAYKCPAGIWTIGYGSTGPDIVEGLKITKNQAEERLKNYLVNLERNINKLGLPINQNQFDALVSFGYNVGFGNLRISTLLKKVKEKAPAEEITEQFIRWNKAAGRELLGLTKRRKEEAALFNTK